MYFLLFSIILFYASVFIDVGDYGFTVNPLKRCIMFSKLISLKETIAEPENQKLLSCDYAGETA